MVNAFTTPVLDGGIVGAAKSPHLSLATALSSLLVPGISDIVIKAGTPASIVTFGSMLRTELVVSETELEAWATAQDGRHLDLADGQRAQLIFYTGPFPITLHVRILPSAVAGETASSTDIVDREQLSTRRAMDEAFGLGV